MQETRQNRISRLLQKELATIFQEQTRQMHGVMVSVTRVKISPDLSICTAYLSIFPSEKSEEILKNVTANTKTIRYDLGCRVRNQLRIIPELRFFIDDSLQTMQTKVGCSTQQAVLSQNNRCFMSLEQKNEETK